MNLFGFSPIHQCVNVFYYYLIYQAVELKFDQVSKIPKPIKILHCSEKRIHTRQMMYHFINAFADIFGSIKQMANLLNHIDIAKDFAEKLIS